LNENSIRFNQTSTSQPNWEDLILNKNLSGFRLKSDHRNLCDHFPGESLEYIKKRGEKVVGEIELNLEIKTLKVGYPWSTPWKVNIGLPPIPLPRWHLSSLLTMIEQWVAKWNETFPEEKTFARQYRVPTFIARFDYVTNEAKQETFLYEVESCPAGIGLGCQTIPEFENMFYELGWPQDTLVIVSPERVKGGDDHLWAEVVRKDECSDVLEKRFLFFRGLRMEIPLKWEQKSVVPHPLHQKSKKYGEGWLWERIQRNEVDKIYNIKINKEKWPGVVFKGLESRGTEKIAICLPKRTRKEVVKWLGMDSNIGIHGGPRAALARISDPELYAQRFYGPNKVMITTSVEKQHAYGIWRIYVGYSLLKKRWEILGGFLNLRASLLLHGATDAIFVPMYVPSSIL